MNTLILAAGFGTRLEDYIYPSYMKPLIHIGQYSNLFRIIKNVAATRFYSDFLPDFYIVANNKNYQPILQEIEYIKNESSIKHEVGRIQVLNNGSDTPIGAANDLINAIRYFDLYDDELLVIAGDLFVQRTTFGEFSKFAYRAFLNKLKNQKYRYTNKDINFILAKKATTEDRTQFGIINTSLFEQSVTAKFADDSTAQYNVRIVDSIDEKPENPRSDLISYACYIIGRDNIKFLERFTGDNLGSTMNMFINSCRMNVGMLSTVAYVTEDPIIDLGTKENILLARTL